MTAKKNIGILGAGQTGCDIALTFALNGYKVMILYADDVELRSGQVEIMTENLRDLCDSGLITESEIHSVITRVSFTERMEDLALFADVVFECIVEKLEVKQEYFAKLDKLCVPSTILAACTSEISVTDIAERSVHKERIIGTHFWNPAYLIPLVEVIRTQYVCEDVIGQTYELLEDAGKMPVIVQKDLAVSRGDHMQHTLIREAMSIVEKALNRT